MDLQLNSLNERSPGTAEAPNTKRKKSMQRGLTDTDGVYVEPTTTLKDDDLLIEENMTHCDNSVKDIRNEGWSGDHSSSILNNFDSRMTSLVLANPPDSNFHVIIVTFMNLFRILDFHCNLIGMSCNLSLTFLSNLTSIIN